MWKGSRGVGCEMLQKKLRSHRTQPVAALYARWVLGTLARAEAVSAENECPTLEQFQVYFLCSSSSSSCSCSCCYCCCPLLLDLRKPFDLKCDPAWLLYSCRWSFKGKVDIVEREWWKQTVMSFITIIWRTYMNLLHTWQKILDDKISTACRTSIIDVETVLMKAAEKIAEQQ